MIIGKTRALVTREELKEAMNNMAAGRPVAPKQTPSMGCSIKWKKLRAYV